MFYAGIGSRETPPEILSLMEELGERLAMEGWTLRSGACHGADAAFERGCDKAQGRKTIFIPWSGYEDRRPAPPSVMLVPKEVEERAMEMAKEFHPAWERCKFGARKLHARNCCQLLGPDLATPVAFVLCFTPGGTGSGGTGQALRIARKHGVPIFDFGAGDALESFFDFLLKRSA